MRADICEAAVSVREDLASATPETSPHLLSASGSDKISVWLLK